MKDACQNALIFARWSRTLVFSFVGRNISTYSTFTADEKENLSSHGDQLLLMWSNCTSTFLQVCPLQGFSISNYSTQLEDPLAYGPRQSLIMSFLQLWTNSSAFIHVYSVLRTIWRNRAGYADVFLI